MSTDTPPVFRITSARPDGQIVLTATGELDIAGIDEFLSTLRSHLAEGPVVLDLALLSFLDSSGVHAFDTLMRDVARENWSLALRRDLHENVAQVLRLTGIIDRLPFEEPPGGGSS